MVLAVAVSGKLITSTFEVVSGQRMATWPGFAKKAMDLGFYVDNWPEEVPVIGGKDWLQLRTEAQLRLLVGPWKHNATCVDKPPLKEIILVEFSQGNK